MSNESSKTHTMTGRVISNKMQDTVVILVERYVQHPFYGKFMSRSTKLHVHDAGNTCQLGDVVAVKECRPLSKTKRWILVEVIERSEQAASA